MCIVYSCCFPSGCLFSGDVLPLAPCSSSSSPFPSSHSFPSCSSYSLTAFLPTPSLPVPPTSSPPLLPTPSLPVPTTPSPSLPAASPVLSTVSGEWQQVPLRKAVSPPRLKPAHTTQGPSLPAVASGPGPSSGPPPNLSFSFEDLMYTEDQYGGSVKSLRSRGLNPRKGVKVVVRLSFNSYSFNGSYPLELSWCSWQLSGTQATPC